MNDPAQASGSQEGVSKHQAREQRTMRQRSLFIMVLLMFLVSIVVFVIGTYFFLVPQIMARDLVTANLRIRIEKLEQAAPVPAPPAATTPADTGGADQPADAAE